MKHKPLKLEGDMKYMSIVLKTMIEYLERGDGDKFSYAYNFHTVFIQINDGVELHCHAYETKTMMIIKWRESNKSKELKSDE